MAGRKIHTPVPVCESCWLKVHTKWEPHSVSETGNVLMKLVGVEVPEKVNTGSAEVCSTCGEITVSGIYELSGTGAADDDEVFVDSWEEVVGLPHWGWEDEEEPSWESGDQP